MTDRLPEPLVPKEVDLRGFEFMPLHGEALFNSKTWIGAKPLEKIAMLKIWWHAFSKEVPSSSLPTDDQLLADYAGYGFAVSAWKRVRVVVLRGFVECNDGRLYHPFLAKVVMSSWRARLADRVRGMKARIGSTEKKIASPNEAPNRGTWERLLQAQQQELSQLTEWSVTAHSWGLSQTHKGSEGKGSEGKGGSTPHPPTAAVPEPSEPPPGPAAGASPPETPDPTACGLLSRALREAGVKGVQPAHPTITGWVARGVEITIALQGVALAREQKPPPELIPIAYLEPIVEKLIGPPKSGPRANKQETLEERNRRAVESWQPPEVRNAAG